MDAKSLSIKGVCQNDKLYKIPYFQRHYVWDVPEWERFISDMESVNETGANYFLGALIVKSISLDNGDQTNSVNEKFYVIDGQQRLTTLTIFMKLLHMYAQKTEEFDFRYRLDNDSKTPILVHSKEDKDDFLKVIEKASAQNFAYDNDSNIRKAFNFFNDYFRNIDNHKSLLNAIYAHVNFVVITLDQNDDEQQIFDTINSLGVELTTDELLKNYLYEENNEQEYRDKWQPMFDNKAAREFWGTDQAKSRQAKSQDNKAIERFLHAFVRIKMWDFKDKLTESQRRTFVKKEFVFATCKAFVEKFGVSKQDLANEIIEYAKLYKENLGEDILKERVPMHYGIKRIACLIHATSNYTLVPYVLWVLRNVTNNEEQNNIFGFIEIYVIRRIICSRSNKMYAELFAEQLILQRVDTLAKIKEHFEKKASSATLGLPTTFDVTTNINIAKHNEINARIIYYLYETRLTATSESDFTRGFVDCHAEPMMPLPSKSNQTTWPPCPNPDDEAARKVLSETIGNYVLVGETDNKRLNSIRNKVWADKQPSLSSWASNISCSEGFINNHKTWDDTIIPNRNTALIRPINNIIWKDL